MGCGSNPAKERDRHSTLSFRILRNDLSGDGNNFRPSEGVCRARGKLWHCSPSKARFTGWA